MATLLGLTEITTEVACLESLVVRYLLRYLAEPIVTAVPWWMEFLMKVKSCSSSSGRTLLGIERIANCTQLPCPFFFFFFFSFFSLFFHHGFIVFSYKKLRAALAMERTKPINQNK